MTRIGSIISSREGTLVGDILWFAAIAFVFSVVIGVVVELRRHLGAIASNRRDLPAHQKLRPD